MNNPLKYTDPTGYLIGGGRGNYDPVPQSFMPTTTPVLFVDGIRIEPGSAGYGFWSSSGLARGAAHGNGGSYYSFGSLASGNSKQSYNYNYSSAMAQLGNAITKLSQLPGKYVQLKYMGDNSNGQSVYENPITSELSYHKPEATAFIEFTMNEEQDLPDNFYGMPVYYTTLVNENEAFTLPGIGIFINIADAYNEELKKHEIGHQFYAKENGFIRFYAHDAPVSLISAFWAGKGKINHQDTYTEWGANKLSNEVWPDFGGTSEFPLSPKNNRFLSYDPLNIGNSQYRNNWFYK